MQTERRTVEKRISVHRPVEIVTGDGAHPAVGFTRNLSEAGVRARFDTSMEPGANLLVRLSLVDGAAPIERTARVVWTAPDLYGDGIEVGLRLVGEDDGDPPPAAAAAAPGTRSAGPTRLSKGQVVEVEAGGIGVEAVVTEIGQLEDDGTMRVTLILRDAAVACDGGGEVDEGIYDEERWRPRPFTDAYRTVERYAGPVLRVVAGILVIILGAFAAGAGWAWRRLPRRFTERAEGLWSRLGIPRRAAVLAGVVSSVVSRIAARASTVIHARPARQAGE